MKENKTGVIKKSLLFIIAFTLLITAFSSLSVYAADTSFETQIKAFPESYKPYLRQLHELHPKWKFEALQTGLDWTSSVDAEYRPNVSLVEKGDTDSFKSHELNDYNPSTGVYYQKDSGFVRANKIAVSHYLDPRTYLTESHIFAFEKLSFDSTFTANEIEGALSGSFMANKKISYYDAKGKLIKTNVTYSTAIYNAGKKYNINPCFLASKIVNEVGLNGSGSVTGKNKSYPGIYNFYNIGATDGGDPIAKGLKYAASSGSYGRPWNTPEKAINGGAQFLASSYIAKGQQTHYLQRFNVNPNSTNNPYEHQYMTNLTATASIAYSTYQSYKSNGVLDRAYVFTIPVFKNMPGEKNATGTITLADAQTQTGVLNISCNIRKGPSTNYDTLGVTPRSGTAVTISETVKTDSTNPYMISNYPFWSKITFSVGSQSYTGYVNDPYITLTNYTNVKKGTSYSPVTFKSNSALQFRFVTTNPNIATISDDTTINFVGTGDVMIYAYDSLGHFQRIMFHVTSSSPIELSSPKVGSITQTSAKVSFTRNSSLSSYEVFVATSSGKLVSKVKTTSSVDITGLKANTKYIAYVRGYSSKSGNTFFTKISGGCSFTTVATNPTPNKPTSVQAKTYKYNSVRISWDKASDADGYLIYAYNEDLAKYEQIATAKGTSYYYLDKSDNVLKETTYRIRAYRTVNSKNYYSDYVKVEYVPNIVPPKVSGLKQTSAKTSSLTFSWMSINDITGYVVYIYNDKTKSYEKKDVVPASKNAYTLSSLSPGKSYKIKVRPYVKVYSKNYYGSSGDALKAVTIPPVPTGLKAYSVTPNSHKLTWNKVSGATGYRVFRHDGKKWVKLADTKNTTYTISKLRLGASYKYAVRAYTIAGETVYWGSSYQQITAKALPGVTNSLTATQSTSSIKLTWSKVSGATGYRVFRHDGKKWVKIADTKNTTYNVSKLKSGTSYKYAVKAYTISGKTVYWSAAYAQISTATKPSTPTVKVAAGKNQATVSWNKISGATGYVVYYSTSQNGTYKKLAVEKGTSYTAKKLTTGRTYYFKAAAYKTAGEKNIYSSFSSAKGVKVK